MIDIDLESEERIKEAMAVIGAAVVCPTNWRLFVQISTIYAASWCLQRSKGTCLTTPLQSGVELLLPL